MWKCKYCGNQYGMPYKDNKLEGMMCLAPDCGRFNHIDEYNNEEVYDSDL